MEKWLRMVVDATLFCNGATPEQKYHAVVADTAHGVHVSCLVSVKNLVFEGPTRTLWGCVGTLAVGPVWSRRCRGLWGPWTSPVTVFHGTHAGSGTASKLVKATEM